MNRYQVLCQQYPQHIVFLKAGRFYQVRNESAYLIHHLFGFRLYLSKDELCTGCPPEILNRIKDKVKQQQISYVILDQDVIEEEETYEQNGYTQYEPVFEVMEKKRIEELAKRSEHTINQEILKKTIRILSQIQKWEDGKLKDNVNAEGTELCEIREAMQYAVKILTEVLQNGIRIRNRITIQTPFSIDTEKALEMVSEEPVRISEFTSKINEEGRKENGQMKKLSAAVVTNWLMQNGYLEEMIDDQNRKNRIATKLGESIGIKTLEQHGMNGTYQTNWYNQGAQRFLVEHLNQITQ